MPETIAVTIALNAAVWTAFCRACGTHGIPAHVAIEAFLCEQLCAWSPHHAACVEQHRQAWAKLDALEETATQQEIDQAWQAVTQTFPPRTRTSDAVLQPLTMLHRR